MDWWQTITTFEKVLWYIAVPSTVITLFQIIMSVFGMGHHDADMGGVDVHVDTSGLDHDISTDVHDDIAGETHDGDGDHADTGDGHGTFRLLSFRTIVAFCTFFSWTGIVGVKGGLSTPVTLILAFVVGFVIMLVMAGILYFLTSFTESGNIKIHNVVGSVATVYLPIPDEKSGTGMVQVSIAGAVRELSAMTEGEKLKTGEKVKILSLIDKQTVLVKKI